MGRLGASLMVALALLCAIVAPWHVVSWGAAALPLLSGWLGILLSGAKP
jgi:hypothetical protein